MFVEITEEKTPLEAERIYNRCYRGGEEITPDVCMEVLRSTNYAACIKRMLFCVEKLPKEKQAAFKEVVLSVLQEREQPAEVAEILERLATASGYADELKSVPLKDKFGGYLRSSAKNIMRRPNNNLYRTEKDLDVDDYNMWEKVGDTVISGAQLSGHNTVCFNAESCLVRAGGEHLPENMFFSNNKAKIESCDLARVNNIRLLRTTDLELRFLKNLPPFIDICPEMIYACGCDFEGVEKFQVRDCKSAMFSVCENFRCGAAFTRVKGVIVSDMELLENGANKPQFQFDEVGTACFYRVENLSGVMDLSSVDVMRFSELNMEKIDELIVKDGASARFDYLKGNPKDFHFDKYAVLDLEGLILSDMDELKFRDGAQVSIGEVVLPKKVDFSNCWLFEVTSELGFGAVEELVVSDYEQYKKLMKGKAKKPTGFKVRYTNEENGFMADLKRKLGGR